MLYNPYPEVLMAYELRRKNVKVEALQSTGDQVIGGNLSVTGAVTQTGNLTMNGETNWLAGTPITNRWIYEEDFSKLTQAGLAGKMDVSNVTGLGTNVVSNNTNLLTTGTATNDKESTTLVEATGPFLRAQTPRFYAKFKMGSVADIETLLGFINAASDTVAIVLDTATSPNFAIRLDDGTSEDIDTGITPVIDTVYEVDISIAVDGTPTVKIDEVAVDLSSSTKKMTANAHTMEYSVKNLSVPAVAKTLTVVEFRVSQEVQ